MTEGPSKDSAVERDGQPASLSIMQRRWRKFRGFKRGWYSFLILTVAYIVSFFNPVLINDRALIVKYDGRYYFPFMGRFLEARDLGQRKIGEAHYRKLQEQYREENAGNWVLLPIYPYHPNHNLLKELSGMPPHPPSAEHWFGTDDRGRDVLARLAYGFNNSMTFAICVILIGYGVGVSVGACFGFFQGRVDMYGQRLVEIWAGLPFLYTVMIIGSIVTPSLFMLVAIVALFFWVPITYYIRGEFYREKAKDYVAAAIAQGESRLSIMCRHILPNALTPIISFAPFHLVAAIGAIVSLDFLGFGLPAPTPSWGELLDQGLRNLTSGEWHLVWSPIGAIFLTLLMVVFIGEAIREAFDPKVFSRLR